MIRLKEYLKKKNNNYTKEKNVFFFNVYVV